ncbi:MAG: DoxX family protein [Pseudomonadota bacterium]
MEQINTLTGPAGRILLGGFWLYFGLTKLGGIEGLQGYMASQGVPGFLVYAVIALEIGGGLALLAGAFSRYAALLLALFSLATAFLFHNVFADPGELNNFAKNIAIAGGLLMITTNGPGRFAVNQA